MCLFIFPLMFLLQACITGVLGMITYYGKFLSDLPMAVMPAASTDNTVVERKQRCRDGVMNEFGPAGNDGRLLKP